MAMKFFSGVLALGVLVASVEAAPPRSNTLRRPTTTQKTAPKSSTKPKTPGADASGSPKTVTPSTTPGNNTFAPPPVPGATIPTPPTPKREEDAATSPKATAPVADAPGSPSAPKAAIPHPAVSAEVKTTTVAPDANGKYLFRYHFSNGETLRWRTEHRAKIDTSVAATDGSGFAANQSADSVTFSTKAWKIVETTPGGETKLVHVVEAIDMRQKLSGGTEVRYNSETDQDVPPIFAGAARQVGKPLAEVTIDARGNIVARNEKSEGKTATLVLPDVPLAIGETWTMPLDLSVNDAQGTPKAIKARRKLTLEKVEGSLATLKNETQILSPLTNPAVEAQLVLEHAEQAGTVVFDLSTGRLVEQNAKLDKEVFGFQGAESKLHYVTEYREALVDAKAATTAKAAGDAQR